MASAIPCPQAPSKPLVAPPEAPTAMILYVPVVGAVKLCDPGLPYDQVSGGGGGLRGGGGGGSGGGGIGGGGIGLGGGGVENPKILTPQHSRMHGAFFWM